MCAQKITALKLELLKILPLREPKKCLNYLISFCPKESSFFCGQMVSFCLDIGLNLINTAATLIIVEGLAQVVVQVSSSHKYEHPPQ